MKLVTIINSKTQKHLETDKHKKSTIKTSNIELEKVAKAKNWKKKKNYK